MGLFAWPGRNLVGCPEMDDDHLPMLQLLDSLHAAMIRGRGSAVIGRVLSELAEHEAVHFAREETLMRSCRYPGLSAHARNHQRMLAELEELQWRAAAGHLPIAYDTMQAMRGWVREHMNGDDRSAAQFIMGEAGGANWERNK
jgi:hemerythrin-like metal-binding protein